jgi:hypothetical protein
MTMSELLMTRYKRLQRHLGRVRREARELMQFSDDLTAKILINLEFSHLREELHNFARFQLAMDLPPRRRQRGTS